MSRYKVGKDWDRTQETEFHGTVVAIEIADLTDTQDGRVYRFGAYRVTKDGKPVSGKGGTVPFKGETAWMDAERLHRDILFAVMRES